MTHMQSAFEAKRNQLCPWANMVPKEGTRTREIFDYFKNRPGKPVEISCTRGTSALFARLQDSYGFDLRRVGPRQWVLAGEWFGKAYVDYIAANLEKNG